MQSDVETRSLRLSQRFDPKTKKTNAPQYSGLKTEDETLGPSSRTLRQYPAAIYDHTSVIQDFCMENCG